jgi:hypothetical protein
MRCSWTRTSKPRRLGIHQEPIRALARFNQLFETIRGVYRLADLLPTTEMRVIAGGHTVAQAQASEVAPLLDSFLRR